MRQENKEMGFASEEAGMYQGQMSRVRTECEGLVWDQAGRKAALFSKDGNMRGKESPGLAEGVLQGQLLLRGSSIVAVLDLLSPGPVVPLPCSLGPALGGSPKPGLLTSPKKPPCASSVLPTLLLSCSWERLFSL